MTKLDAAAVALPIIGGLNWGLVGAKRFDLVARLTGNRFGETNKASRAIYGLVAVGAVYTAVRLARGAAAS
jgi:uncharacterized membrane protein YuzA (DUF378 family)